MKTQKLESIPTYTTIYQCEQNVSLKFTKTVTYDELALQWAVFKKKRKTSIYGSIFHDQLSWKLSQQRENDTNKRHVHITAFKLSVEA